MGGGGEGGIDCGKLGIGVSPVLGQAPGGVTGFARGRFHMYGEMRSPRLS